MTKQESINKFLVEEVEGGQWLNCSCGWKTHLGCCDINDNPDFSLSENFIRLLKIAEKKDLFFEISFHNKIWTIDVSKRYGLEGLIIETKKIDLIPSLVAENLAKSLGWKEGE